jgi:hypothetical protein
MYDSLVSWYGCTFVFFRTVGANVGTWNLSVSFLAYRFLRVLGQGILSRNRLVGIICVRF